ncbi:DUF2141 domain-containing protein [Leptonema illini]|uniref:DUF2141 domain-containing protein n=1 Tax=Leptonema illini DSM 21528 TaxID=929563 RepID=H2CHP1_9LEPT|nr:DUF2141 domain-containing protein [Leptonema illini]EHQ05886.1 Protein of unknown function DUF2141 [Leptonema illini DSM 21528]
MIARRLFQTTALLFSLLASAATANTGRTGFELVVTGLRNDTGIVGVLVFQSANGFPDERARAVLQTGARPSNGTARIALELQRGQYAFAVIHDENENHRMDWKTMMPAEGFGFSRNPTVRVSAPTFDESVINVPPSAQDAVIRLQYF